ncbi:MAG: hypothetical protein ACREQX_15720 [Candidatus Binataceae bacterium]
MDFLLFWPNWAQVLFILVVFSGVSILGLYAVRVAVPLERLKQNHEVAGFTFGVLGAFYGLLLAFVIVAAWNRYDRADQTAQGEATAVTALYRLGKGFSEPAATRMRSRIRAYTREAIQVEWPAMKGKANGVRDNPTGTLGLWQIVANYKPASPRQILLVDKSYDQLALLSKERSLRFLYGRESFPSVVWMVIYAGLFITIGFSYFFGLEKFKSQALMCGVFSCLLGLTILAILELAHPYQGTVVVSDAPFQYALVRMNEMDKVAWGSLSQGNLKFAGESGAPARRILPDIGRQLQDEPAHDGGQRKVADSLLRQHRADGLFRAVAATPSD